MPLLHPGLRQAALLVAGIGPLTAVDLGDLTGDWSLAELRSPSRLREVYYDVVSTATRTSEDSSDFANVDEILIDAFYPDPLATETRSFSIGAGGTVSGGETGQILGISSNRILYSDGTEAVTVYSNTTGDLLLASSRDDDQQDQTLCLKRPSDLDATDLDGDWALIALTCPDDLSRVQAEGRLADVYFSGESTLATGDITMDGAGNFSGIFSGTISGTPTGDVTVVTGGGSIPFRMNESKNVAASTPGDDDEQEFNLLIRKPSSLATSDLAGTWRVSILRLPTTLTESFYNIDTTAGRQADSAGTAGPNEVLVDIFHADFFELERLEVELDSSGSFTGTRSGTFTANPDRSVTLSSGGDLVTFFPNADKTLMAGAVDHPDSHELVICIKTADTIGRTAAAAADLRMLRSGGKLILSWNGTSGLLLEESDGLAGWTTIENSSGTDSHVSDPATDGSRRFFRLAEQP